MNIFAVWVHFVLNIIDFSFIFNIHGQIFKFDSKMLMFNLSQCRGQSSGQTQAFRSSYGQLAELRSSLPTVPVVAMTATATTNVRLKVAQGLGMSNYVTVMESPDKPNIKHVVLEMKDRDFDCAFQFIIQELVNKGKDVERTIIYCQSRKVVSELYALFFSEVPRLYHKHFDMYHTNTEGEVQERIVDDFSQTDGQIRVLIATIAFGMGVDVKGTHNVIILGRPSDLDDYVQMSGRIGRDGKASTAILVRYPGDAAGRKVMPAMAKYTTGDKCRRQMILESFSATPFSTEVTKHDCCDVCASLCTCSGSTCSSPIPGIEGLARKSMQRIDITNEYPIVIPSAAQLDKLRSSLEDFRDTLVIEDPDHIYCGKDIASGLSVSTIEQIIRESTISLSREEYMRRYRFSSSTVAERTWDLYVSALERRGDNLPHRQVLSEATSHHMESDESDLWSEDEFADVILDRSASESD